MKRRAEQQAETRRRIVEAAVELHSTVGPARTTVSMLAERAGVQRHTLYAHFPDEWSVLLACSGHVLERDPLPNPEPWRAIQDPRERVRTGLGAIYGWYARNAAVLACTLRDSEHHAPTREINELRFWPAMAAYREILGAELDARDHALLLLALSFHTWRTLVQEASLEQADAAAAMVEAICSARIS
ncbi:TetR/AcrR family transcriptional regulator [Sphingomonas cavernae]|uniref:TetR/AcrR family transcriptional regulator n=1 Tax=Sphingomonas cavernae TaxID=2320861 RepID=UPI001C721931|nr:TetR/AcrR family transcriptional regulator [Sphingomonas cavernae]